MLVKPVKQCVVGVSLLMLSMVSVIAFSFSTGCIT